MSAVLVETTADEPPPGFDGDTAALLAFLSFLAAERYGSTHALSALARRLRREFGVDTRPLEEFGDAEPEDDADRANLERLWQPAAPLAESAAQAAAALRTHDELAALATDAPDLATLLDRLADNARWAAARDARIRLTYLL
jgi:hypothetical protein